ncbi:MAG: methylmalonyl-CoA mutase family protein, partial [Clostridiales bacterium]|nr:methylmalonyl-CoA mutase family protein [Clostridiales bacterium]
SFFFVARTTLLEEVAKFRAARRLWAHIMRDEFGAKDPRSQMLRFHTQTAGCTLTAQQPDVNVVRVAFQALSAVLGGTQSLHTNSRDEALALPSESSVLIALRTQQVIAYETGMADTVDPLGGSYMVEALTSEIEEKVWEYLRHIDSLGGAVAGVEQGYMQREIHRSAYAYQKAIESGEQVVVGVNKFTIKEEAPQGLLRVDPKIGELQIEKTRKVRAERDAQAVRRTLAALREAGGGSENLMPFIIAAVKEYATLGEICDVLREVFSEYQGLVIL